MARAALRRSVARAALAAGALAAGTLAHAGDMLPKTTTIAGTIASWTVAFVKGAPVGSCLVEGPKGRDGWGARLQEGRDKELSMWQLGVVRRDCHLTQLAGFDLDVAPVVSVARWQADPRSVFVDQGGGFGVYVNTPSQTAWDVAAVPMLHWKLPLGGGGLLLDTEVGIGPDYLSRPSIGTRHKSTNFQFSDHLGLGVATADGHWRAMLAYRHVSNANIKEPNNAVDFKGVVLEYRP